jgi:hypothetical protein
MRREARVVVSFSDGSRSLPGKKTLPKRVVSLVPSHRRRRGSSARALHFPFRANGARASPPDEALRAICFCPLHPKSCCLRTLVQAATARVGEMRQQEKLAAAAKELLKADSSRQRKASAAQSRKGPVSRRKGTAVEKTIGKTSGRAAAAIGKATRPTEAVLTRKSGGGAMAVLTDKRRIPLRSASVRTPHLFHHGIPKVLVNPRSKGITSVRSTTTH